MDRIGNLQAPKSAIKSVRAANQWLKEQNRADLKVSSRQNGTGGRVYTLSCDTSVTESPINVTESYNLNDIIAFAMQYYTIGSYNTSKKKKVRVIKDVESFNEWLQSSEVNGKLLDGGSGSYVGNWELEMRENKSLGRLYNLKNKITGVYWNYERNFMRGASLNILAWIETIYYSVNLYSEEIDRPKYIGGIIKADSLVNANRLLYLRGVNKGEDWSERCVIKQQGDKFIAVNKVNNQGRVVFTGKSPAECLRYYMKTMRCKYPEWVYN